ncbi:lantibiotic dehydratase [Kitasatospora kifunensis]
MSDNVLLPGGSWRLWSHFALRGAGFPASGVSRLAPAGLAAAADEFGVGDVLSGPRWEGFVAEFGVAAVGTAVVLQEVAGLGSFRAAVAWQNRAVLGSGIGPFLGWVPSVVGRTSMPRQREELVAHYWQRFCVKNDTIGFFGPVGWGRLDRSVRGPVMEPGEGLIVRSAVYFSSWSIDALARTLDEQEPGLREWLAPRRVPFVRVDTGSVTVPGRPAQPVTPVVRRVLECCDGTRAARDIQRELGVDASLLADLVKRRWISWRLEVPADAHPERHLRATLESVGDRTLRESALAKLELLERGRDRVQAAAGAEELTQAMAALEADFMTLTDTAAARAKGAGTAPGRTLVYSDSTRAATARIGGDVLAALAPLELLMTSATWLASRLADRVRSRAEVVFDQLGAAAGAGGRVDLAAFWFACMPILHGDAVSEAAAIQREFWLSWAGILGLTEDPKEQGRRREVRVTADQIADAVREAFGRQGAAWTAARYLSPDVLIAARDAAAVERGEFELVLGELHVATNTIGASLFVNQHPAPAELLAQTGRDHPGPRLMPLLPKEHRSRLSIRVRHVLVRPEDYYIALVDNPTDPRRARTVLGADVTVERREGRLVVRLPDGAVFDALDVFSHVLTTLVMDLCRILPEADHSPRVTVDKLVLARESWRYVAGELGFAREKDEARRFVRARRWRDEDELPRFVFVVSPTEPRPFFVDFDSPVYVNIFAKAVRRLAAKDPQARLTITEMLPTPEQTWLTDDQGNGYTAELRFVALAD